MMDESLFELTDLYLKGKLPSGHPFVEEVNTDPVLAEEVEVQRSLKEAVIDFRVLHFQDILKQYHEKAKLATPRFNWAKYVPLLIFIASLTAIVLVYKDKKVEVLKKPVINELKPDENEQRPVDMKTSAPSMSFNQKPPRLSPGVPSSPSMKENMRPGDIQTIRIDSAPIKDPVSLAETSQPTGTVPDPPIQQINDPCLGHRVSAHVVSTPACTGKSDGSILLEEINGGIQPLLFSIDHGNTYQASPAFTQVGQGKYALTAKDGQGCVSVVDADFYLNSKNCAVVGNLSFHPSIQGTLEIPKEWNEAGTISIYDKSGQVLVRKSMSPMENMVWDGTAGGQLLLPGLYLYTIQYDSRKEEQGTITIMY
jgi:hypothetical protein